MVDKLVPISTLVDDLKAAAARKDGYIMGATGQDPKTWKTTSWWFTQYSGKQKTKALYWREHASRVWDCNGLSEGIYKDHTGIDINTKARYNFYKWCSVKGWGRLPKAHRKVGVAVFKASKSGSYSTIHHVGYITGVNSSGQLIVTEAKGVMYGVVQTVYEKDSKWNAWGYMDKYFDYEAESVSDPEPTVTYSTIKKGSTGADVKALQELLIAQGYDLGSYGADGDFGSKTDEAVRKYQQDHGLTVDGIVGKQTWAVLTGEKSA